MAGITIKFELEDIVTTKIGFNYMISGKGITLIMTPEAIDELIKDYTEILTIEKEKEI